MNKMNKKALSERDNLLQVHKARSEARGLERDDADPRGGRFHQGAHHGPGKARYQWQCQARRLHPSEQLTRVPVFSEIPLPLPKQARYTVVTTGFIESKSLWQPDL
jgi:hypothetical protein